MHHHRIHTTSLTALLALSLLTQSGHAAGTTSAAFLRLGSGARAASMGDAFTARADDASATYWNPAGMSGLKAREFMAEHVLHIQDVNIDRVSYVHPFGNSRRALGVSATYLALDGIEGRTGNTPEPDRTFGANDFYGAVSYSHPLSASLSAGLTGKAVRQEIDGASASAYAADLGVLYRVGRIQAGATLANVGTAVKFVDRAFALPRTLRGGVAFDAASLPLKFSVEAEQLKGESTPSYRMGMEYDTGGMLALRGGYLARSRSDQSALKGEALGSSSGGLGGWVGMAGGFGLRFAGYRFDYAFTPFGDLGSAHRMSFGVGF